MQSCLTLSIEASVPRPWGERTAPQAAALLLHLTALTLALGLPNHTPLATAPEPLTVELIAMAREPEPPQATPEPHPVAAPAPAVAAAAPPRPKRPAPVAAPLATQPVAESAPAVAQGSAVAQGVPAPQAAPVVAEEPLVPPDGRAAYLNNPRPAYPRAARQRGMEGVVVVTVTVAEDGAAIEAAVRQGTGFSILDQAALEAVRSWRFVPARRGGKAVRATVDVPVRFALSDA